MKLTMQVPVGEVADEQYMARHVDVNRLTQAQATTLTRLRNGLDAAQAKTANGKRVTTNTDAVRWLLETIGTEVVKANGRQQRRTAKSK